MRPLVIDEQLKAEVQALISYAREHHYIVGETMTPGDDPRHVLTTEFGYRCVFSFTRTANGPLYRDLSISVPSENKWPHPFAVFTIAELFGFTGWDHETIKPPESWQIAKDIYFNAIRIAQEIEATE